MFAPFCASISTTSRCPQQAAAWMGCHLSSSTTSVDDPAFLAVLDEVRHQPAELRATFEELARIVGVFLGVGVAKVRLTGGEPLLRRDILPIVRRANEKEVRAPRGERG